MAFSILRREAEKEREKRQGRVETPVSPANSVLIREAARERGEDVESYIKSRALRSTISGVTNTPESIRERALEIASGLGTGRTEFPKSAADLKGNGGRTGADIRSSTKNAYAVQPEDFKGGVKPYEIKPMPEDYESILSELETAENEYKAAFDALTRYETSQGLSADYTDSEYYYALSSQLGKVATRRDELEKAKEKYEFDQKAKEQAGTENEYVAMTDEELNAKIAALKKEMDTVGINYTGGGRNKSDGGRSYGTGGGRNKADNETWRAASAELAKLEKEIERRQELAAYSTDVNKDNFFGRFESNFDVGQLNELVNEAYSNYLWNPTDANKAYADQLAATLNKYQENNAAALDDDGWISKSAAGYLPQLGHQLEAGLGGAAVLGATGAGVGSAVPGIGTGTGALWGARTGYVAGTGVYSYNSMRGAAYRRLIELGADEQTARAAAQDEAVINALIEMVDAGVDLATLGTAKIASPTVKKVAKFLMNYGINIGTEAIEEGAQETVSIANDERITNKQYDPNSSLWSSATGLGFDTIGTGYNVVTGRNPEAGEQIWESMKEGGKIAAMFGGAGMAANGTINTISANNTGKNIQSSGSDLDILINLGRTADPKTESYQIATALLKKQNTGKKISNTEVGWLYRAIRDEKVLENGIAANRTTEDERAAVSDWGDGNTYTLEQLARETAEERENATQSAPVTLEELARETVAERAASQQAQAGAATGSNSRSAADYQAAIKKWTGYGDSGVKAFTEALEQSDADPEAVRAGFQAAYESGLAGIERKSVELITPLQEQAFIAGTMDYMANQAKDKAKTFKVSDEAGFDRTGAPKDVTDTQAEILDMLAKNLGSKSYFDGDQDFNAQITGDGTVRYSTSFQREIRDESGNVVKTLTVVDHALHELGAHRAMQVAPDATRAFINKFYSYLMENSPSTAATLAERKQQFYGSRGKSLTTDKAFEEVIANEIFSVLYRSDEQELRRALSSIFDGKDAQQVKKGARTFKDVLHDMWQKIKDFAAKLRRKGDIAAAREAEQVADSVKELRDMFENVLKVAAEQVKAKQENSVENRAEQEYNGSNESQLSAKYWKPQLTKKEWNLLNTRMEREIGSSRRVIDDATKWLYANENGTTVFAVYGIGDGTEATPLYASGGKQAKADYNKWSNFWEGYLNEPDADRTDFDSWLESVRSEQGYQRGNLYDSAGRTADADNDRVHGRASERNGNRASGAGKENRGSVITDEDTQNSLKDSAGRTLSPGQQEYFKDSKARDEDGNLLVMYHGTPDGDFTVFKDGSYFTGSKEYADRYQSPSASSISTGKEATAPKTFAVYLDIKKPFDITDSDARDIYINEYIKGGNAMGINPYLSDAEYRKIKTIDWTEGEDLRDFLVENGYDYDGLVLDEGADGGYGDEVSYRGQSYVVFSPEQVKDVDNLNPTSDPDIQFSLKTPRESSKNLLAIHNKNAESILAALDLGGFPMPSIAIVKNDMGHEKFGDISVLFRKETIDPQFMRRNKVYGADAWTPTKPSVGYKVDEKVRKRLESRIEKLLEGTSLKSEYRLMLDDTNMDDSMNRWDGDFKRAYKNNEALKIAFLKDNGIPFKPVMKEHKYDGNLSNDALRKIVEDIGADRISEAQRGETGAIMKFEPIVRKYYNEQMHETFGGSRFLEKMLVDEVPWSKAENILRNAMSLFRNGAKKVVDTVATTDRLNKKFTKKMEAEYEAWLDEISSGIIEKKGLRNNKDMFTPSGNRRSFEQLYMEYNLDNIVEAMANEEEKGGGVLGTGNIFGAATKEYSSIADIKADADRLVMEDEETHKAEHEAFTNRLSEIVSRMIKAGDNGFGATLDAGDAAVDALLRGKTVKGILRELKSWRRFNATEQIAQDIYDLAQDISEAPTTYFEAKPRRAVGFDEVAAVVMPRNSSAELKARLEDMGIQVLTYNPNKEGDRLKKINSVDGAQFSLKEQNDLLKENAKLKEVNEALREQFKRTELAQVDKKSLDKFTKQLLKDYQSGADINEIRDALNDVYNYMANGEDGQHPVWNDLQERAYNVAVSILENASTVNDDMYQAYKGLRDRLRNYSISIDKRYNNDIQGYESIEAFRRANFGRIKITNDGTPVDIVYSELANTYPEFFDESEYTTQADQLTHIADVLDSLQPYEVNPYSANMRQAATWLASDIIERFYELPQAKPTFADKQAAKLTKQVIKDAKKLESLRDKKNERIKELIRKNREKVKATTQKEREKRVEAVKEIKEHYKDKERKASESRKARELRAKIMRHAQDMSKKLLRPTDKQHIPQKLQGAVAKLLEAINLESNYTYDSESKSYKKNDEGLPSNRTKAFAELRKLYAEMANELVIDPDLLGEDGLLSDVAALADKRIADMTSEELETVYRTLRAVEATVSSANKAFAESRWASIEEAAESIRLENENKRQVAEYAGVVGWGQKLTGLDMMTPSAFFHRLGESGDGIFRMMRDAQDKHIKLMKAVEDFTHKELDAVPVKKWEKEMHTVKLGGEDVQLTTAQIMELYVLTKRKQAQDHIFMGGILPESVANKGIKKITRAEPVRGVDIGEVSKAVSLLTEEQKKIADKLQEYASTELSKWGNEAAMQVYNYEKFNEAVYWPIRSNRQEIASTVEKDTQVTSVAGRGFSKNTKPNANTSVKIGSIFDTFATHSSEMATYAAWLATAEDINRIRNYTFLNEDGGRTGTVKGVIERVHGSRGTQYLQKLLSDIANGVGAGRGNETRMDWIVGNYKASAIGANLRVIIQQPTALLRALDMIDAKYLPSAKSPVSGWKKAKKYAPIAQWKDWGYFDISTGRQMKDVFFETDRIDDKVKQFTMAGAGLADSISWGTLWNAVENEVKATRENLNPGTDEFYKAVAARFTEIVDHTQVVDGILQRSQIMRSADGLTKMVTSFMGEPTKQYNMLMTALYDFQHTEGKERTIARKRFGRTMTALVISGVVNAMAQSIIDAVRDDDDEKEYWEKWLSAFLGLEGDEETIGEKAKAIAINSNLMNIFNPAGYIPYAKDVVSLFQGYDVSRMDMESIEKTISSWRNLWDAIHGEGNYTIRGAAINFVGEAARMIGIPAANLKREIVSFATTFAQESDNLVMQYRMEKFFTNVQNSGGSALDILFNAYQNDSEAYAIIYKDMLASGFDPEKLKNGMETRMKKAAGVTKTSELESRYMHPDQQAEYDSKMKTIQRSNVWKNANEEQRGKLEDNLYNIVSGTGTGENLMETISEGAPFGLDETEYLLYKLALETVDQPNESGNYGSYTSEEKAAALSSAGLGDGEMAYLWGTDQALEAFAYGIDMQKYIAFKSAVGSIKADKDRRGKSISGSREKKIKAYLRSLGVSNLEYWYLLGTEYDLKDDPNYRRYFG